MIQPARRSTLRILSVTQVTFSKKFVSHLRVYPTKLSPPVPLSIMQLRRLPSEAEAPSANDGPLLGLGTGKYLLHRCLGYTDLGGDFADAEVPLA